jgi:ankyrin repeat protein
MRNIIIAIVCAFILSSVSFACDCDGVFILDGQDEDGNTALHHEAAVGDFEMVEALLEGGADPAILNNEGKLPFEIAQDCIGVCRCNCYYLTAEALFDSVAGPGAYELVNDGTLTFEGQMSLDEYKLFSDRVKTFNAQDCHGTTLLHRFAAAGDLQMVNWLLSMSAEYAVLDENNKLPFELAYEAGNYDVAEALFDRAAGEGTFQEWYVDYCDCQE